MRAPPGAGRLLAALLLLAAAAPASAEPVADGFEAATLGPLWNLRFRPNAVSAARSSRSAAAGS